MDERAQKRDIGRLGGSSGEVVSGGGAASPGAGWEYAVSRESLRVEVAGRYGHFIGGAFTEAGREPGGGEARLLASVNPATEEVLSEVTVGGVGAVDAAVGAARGALDVWRGLSGLERGKYLYRIARRIQERARELAVLESMDGGKPIRESRDEDVPLVAHHFFYHAGWADKLGHVFGGSGWEPHGVCGQIIPWNFPLLMLAWKVAPALACGNTVVLKPAETTPLTALRFGEICAECGLPDGVVNIVTGDGGTGAAMTGHGGFDKIAFTGSTPVGKEIARAAGARGVPVTLELGGKGAHIVFEDAALDQAIEGVVRGIYFNQGHVCCAGSRLLVQESVLGEVLGRLERRMGELRVGDPLDKNTDVGAINSREQLERIEAYIGEGEREGAECVVGGVGELPGRGYWVRPCVFRGVHQSHRIAREEVFGPVLAVIPFRTAGEAVRIANNTRYGLSAGVWTEKGSKMFEVASGLRSGVVWCNTFNRFDPSAAFGGMQESGMGREGGAAGLRAYVRLS